MGYYHLGNYPVSEFPRITHFGYCNGESGRNIARHYHLGFEVVYVKHGDVRVDTLLNHAPLRLRDDTVYLMPPLMEHNFRVSPSDMEYYWIGVQTDSDIGVSQDHRIPPRALIPAPENHVTYLVPDEGHIELAKLGAALPHGQCAVMEHFPQVAPVFATLYEEIVGERPMRVYLIYAKIIELLSLIHRRLGAVPYSARSNAINLTIDHIRAHYREELTLETLSDYIGFHPSYLSRLFQRETGKKISSFIREVRIETAKRLLIEGEPVAFVAKECGFRSIYAFSATFKRTVGTSPTGYRRKGLNAISL